MQNCREWPELVELCMKCLNEDCTSEDGCKTYKQMKRRLERDGQTAEKEAPKPRAKKAATAKEKPPEGQGRGIMFEMPPEGQNPEVLDVQMGTAETLRRCNDAIRALEALIDDADGALIIPRDKAAELLRELKAARIESYARLIDWESIANAMEDMK